jgi:hypothetical protein
MTITLPLSPIIGDIFVVNGKSWEWTGYSWDAAVTAVSRVLSQTIQVEEAAVLIGTQNTIAKRQLKGQRA